MIYKYLQYVRCNENVGLSKMTPIFLAFIEEAGGLIGLGRCLAEITSISVLPLFSLRRLTRHPVINLLYTTLNVRHS